MFGPRYRRPPLTEPLNWTDYRWDPEPWRGAHRFHRAGPWTRRRSPFPRLLLAGLAVLVGAKLYSSLQARNGSWARRGLYAVLLLLLAGAVSRYRWDRR